MRLRLFEASGNSTVTDLSSLDSQAGVVITQDSMIILICPKKIAVPRNSQQVVRTMMNFECDNENSSAFVCAKIAPARNVSVFVSDNLFDRTASITVTVDNRTPSKVELQPGTPLALIFDSGIIQPRANKTGHFLVSVPYSIPAIYQSEA